MTYDLSQLIADIDKLMAVNHSHDDESTSVNETEETYPGNITMVSCHMGSSDPGTSFRAELRQLKEALSEAWLPTQHTSLNQQALSLLRLIVHAQEKSANKKIAAMTRVIRDYHAHPDRTTLITTLIEKQWQSIFLKTGETHQLYEYLTDKSFEDSHLTFMIDVDADDSSDYQQALKELKSALARYDVHHINIISGIPPDIQSQQSIALFSNYIQDLIQKAENVREHRSKNWLKFIQNATFKPDKNARFGWRASFSVSGWLTDIPDKKLAEGFELMTAMLTNDRLDPTHLLQLQQFSNSLPSSAYKHSIDKIYQALLIVTLITLLMLAPMTIPAISGLLVVSVGCFAVGNAIIGLACHFSVQAYLTHLAEDRYDALHLDLLNSVMGLQQSDQLLDLEVAAYLKQLLDEIKQAKIDGQISTDELAKALAIIQRGLRGDTQALNDLEHLQQSMQFSYFNDTLSFMSRAIVLAHRKYQMISGVLAALTAVQIVGSGISSYFAYQTAASFIYGTIPVVLYESADQIIALPRQLVTATIAFLQFLSRPSHWGPTAWRMVCHVSAAISQRLTSLFASPQTPLVEPKSLAQQLKTAQHHLQEYRESMNTKQEKQEENPSTSSNKKGSF